MAGHQHQISSNLLNFSFATARAEFVLWNVYSDSGFLVSLVLVVSAAVLKQQLVALQRRPPALERLMGVALSPAAVVSLLYFSQILLGFLLMLVTMGLNFWVLLAVVGGLTFGDHVFSAGKQQQEEECC